MDLINNLLNILLPVFIIPLLILLFPALQLFNLFKYFLRYVSPEKVAGKVVLITGASSGIGEYLAYEYAKRGACLALVARREPQLQAVAGKARELGSPDVIVVSADVSKHDDCKRSVDETINHFGTLDHLVNNAGITLLQGERSASNSDYVSLMDINFWGSIYTTQYALPHLRKQKGKVVVVSSSSGWLSIPRLGIYGASKAALISFFDTLRVEVGSDIGITIVTPGVIESPMSSEDTLSQANLKWLPIVRTEECAKAILESTRRGDDYVTVPAWVRVFFLMKTLCPALANWTSHFLFITCSNVSVADGSAPPYLASKSE